MSTYNQNQYCYDYDIRAEAQRRLGVIKGFAIAGFIMGIIVGFMMFGLVASASKDPKAIFGLIAPVLGGPALAYLVASIPVGWRKVDDFLRENLPDFILIMPIIGWLILFGIKFMFAYYVGVVALPFEYSKLKKIVNSKAAETNVQRAPSSMSGWRCSKCGTHNSNYATHCLECDAKR